VVITVGGDSNPFESEDGTALVHAAKRKETNIRRVKFFICEFYEEKPNGWRYAPEGYWWAGQDNAILPEPTSSHANCLKTRTQSAHHASPGALPGVGCTLCWAVFTIVLVPHKNRSAVLCGITEYLQLF
jgi:hypothetical protein